MQQHIEGPYNGGDAKHTVYCSTAVPEEMEDRISPAPVRKILSSVESSHLHCLQPGGLVMDKIREVPRLECPLAKIVKKLGSAAGVVHTVMVQIKNKICRHPVEHIFPLEVSFKNHKDAIKPEENNHPQMLPEPDVGYGNGETMTTTRGIEKEDATGETYKNDFHSMR